MQKTISRFFEFFEQLETHEILIFFIALFFMGYFALAGILGTHDFLAIVTSSSMEPALKQGDLVFLSANTSISGGDIIVFEKNNETVIHRVVEITSTESFRTKGDRNSYKDSFTVQKKEIIGKVIFIIPKILS